MRERLSIRCVGRVVATPAMTALLLTIALAVAATDAAAQTVPVQSSEQLQMVVKPGQRLIVRDQAGKNQGGRLVSITGDRLELEILRPFRFRTSTLSLTEDTVLRIDEQDSLKNGVLIGVGIGAALAAVGTATCHQESCSGAAALGLMLGPLFGGIIGRVVDLSVNRRIYVSSRTPRVVFEPFLGPFKLAWQLESASESGVLRACEQDSVSHDRSGRLPHVDCVAVLGGPS